MNPALMYMRTYSIVRPESTHTRPGTCVEVECAAYLYGWVTTIDPNMDKGPQQVAYITQDRTRHYTATSRPDGLVDFTFPAGQQCFGSHTVILERDPLYLVRRGADGRYADLRTHANPAHWVEDFAGNQDRLARLQGG